MGHGQGKPAKSAQEEDLNNSVSVDPPSSEPEPIFGSPLVKEHAFPAVSEEEAEDVPERRISIGALIKTPSPEPVPRSPEKVKKVPFVFRWNYGGHDVYIAGEFNDWEKNIPLSKSHGDFTGIVELPEGEYQYKFIVDGEWLHDPEEESVDNNLGSKNNVIKVTQKDFQAYDGRDLFTTSPEGVESSSPPGSYTQDVPSYKGATVGLPPHLPSVLQNTILNQPTPMKDDPIVLPEPNPVVLNHLYALSVKDHVLVLAGTHRYKEKYVTTLMYKPV